MTHLYTSFPNPTVLKAICECSIWEYCWENLIISKQSIFQDSVFCLPFSNIQNLLKWLKYSHNNYNYALYTENWNDWYGHVGAVAIGEHMENVGVHNGDATFVLPVLDLNHNARHCLGYRTSLELSQYEKTDPPMMYECVP